MKLALEDGTEMDGRGFGAAGAAVGGEVVFNTGMTGYVETLTDPSYCGQILVFTYPLIGNYGVPAPRKPGTLDGPYESGRIQVQGVVVQNYVNDYSHAGAARSLHEWLEKENVPGVTGVDTRHLTRGGLARRVFRRCGATLVSGCPRSGWFIPVWEALSLSRRSFQEVRKKEGRCWAAV